jgi:hypothetical protein
MEFKMGEAKRRKINDPDWGNNIREAYSIDTHNLFRLDENDYGNSWLVTNLELEELGFTKVIQDMESAFMESIMIGFGLSKPSKQCWVTINDECSEGDVVLGILSHHPNNTSRGIPSMKILKSFSKADRG